MSDSLADKLMQEIDAGLKYRRKYGKEDSWSMIEEMFNNSLDESGYAAPNIIVGSGDSMLASLNVSDPYITIKPRRSDQIEKATITEVVVNRLMKEVDLMTEVDSAILAAFLWGRGFLKVGYDSAFGYDPTFDPGIDEAMGLTFTQFNKKMERIEFFPTTPGMPWVRSVLPHDIVVPPGARDLEDAEWIAHRIIRHIDDIKDDPKYENKKNLQPNVTREDFIKSYERAFNVYRAGKEVMPRRSNSDKSAFEFVEMWEVHDRRSGRIYVVVRDYKSLLRNKPNLLLQKGKLPFKSIAFTPRTRNFWVTSDAIYMLHHQMELTDIAVQGSKHRKLMVLKFLLRDDAWDEEAIAKLLSPTVGAAVRVRSEVPLSETVLPFNHGVPNIALSQEAEMVRRSAREMIGFSRNQIGEFEASGRRTATEASIVAQASNLRLDRRQKAVKQLYQNTVWHMLQCVYDFWQIPQLVEWLGPDGVRKWANVTGEDLQGDYDMEIGFSTGGNETLEQRRSAALQFYLTASQDPLADPIELRRFLVNAMNDPRFTKIFQGAISGQVQVPQGAQQAGGIAELPMGGGGAGPGATGTEIGS